MKFKDIPDWQIIEKEYFDTELEKDYKKVLGKKILDISCPKYFCDIRRTKEGNIILSRDLYDDGSIDILFEG